MAPPPTITTISLPIPWATLDLPDPLQLGPTAVTHGDPGWAWSPGRPPLSVPVCVNTSGDTVEGWDLDHVVVLVPDLEVAVVELAGSAGLSPRLKMDVDGRPTAFYRAGPLLEVIESPVRGAALYGLALVTQEPLDVLALRWRSMGRDLSGPKPANQPGRRVLTLSDTEAGLAVLSPTTAVQSG